MYPGSQQDHRLSPALVPGYFRPDELSLAQRLRQTLQVARQLRFFDTLGGDRGHWGELLQEDLALVLAELAALPLDDWETQADRFAWLAPARARGLCLGLARRLDQWTVRLGMDASGDELPLREALRKPLWRALGDSLGPQLQAMLVASGADASAWQGWHQAWQLEAAGTRAASVQAEPAEDRLVRLRVFWLALCRMLRLLQELAGRHLAASLRTGQHDAGTGLLLAWTQLLHGTRDTLNRFDERLTHHYYADRLGFRARPAQADRVHLVLERDPRYRKPVLLPQGWRFVANLGQGSCSYAAEQALYLSPLRVSQLLTLRQERDPMIAPERQFGLATQVLSRRLDVPTTEQASDPRAPSVPLLGGGPGSVVARQGLAIASPLLDLREGRRTIKVVLAMSPPEGLDAALPESLFTRDADDTLEVEALAAWCVRLSMFEQFEGQAELEGPGYQPWSNGKLAAEVLRANPGLREAPWLAYLVLRCLGSAAPDALAYRLGRLMAVWLCATGTELTGDVRDRLRKHVASVMPANGETAEDDPLSLLYGDFQLERRLVFDSVFRGAWQVLLSVADGWLDVGEAFVERVDPGAIACGGLRASVALTADQPAVVAATEAVHGPGWPALPVMQLRIANRSRLFASSLLMQLRLESAELVVDVEGARTLQMHNQLGRLDPSKPFMPLGPLPDGGSYFVFTHAELAGKPLERLRLNLQWSGLPPLGLADRYAHYPGEHWSESDFRVRLAVLSEARWQEANVAAMPLFGPRGERAQQLDVDVPELRRLHHPAPLPPAPPGAVTQAPEFGLSSRQGFFRLQLAGPADAFGHALYPGLVSETLTHNSRLKPALARPLPLAPYTPVLESMTVDYRASQRIVPHPGAGQARQGELLYIAPFGLQALRRLPQTCPVSVLQRIHGTGQLFVGLEGAAAEGSLSLLFRLRSEAAREPLGRPTPSFRWHVWNGEDWRQLEPHRVLLDTTEGLLRSGIVALDLPAGMARGCTTLPGDCYWLRLSGFGDLDLLAGLVGVWSNGLSAHRLGDGADQALPPGSILAALEATPGLATVRQPWPSFDLRARESVGEWSTRVSERLRHRARALTPWDCERLVLEAFPEVFKLRCIPRSHPVADKHILVVVVPALPAGYEIDGTEAPRLDASTLQRIAVFLADRMPQHQRRIAGFLADRMPPHQPLLVRNASYERIQVRCPLRLARGEPTGERLRELNQSLRDYLSPWRPGGVTTRFDWQVRADDVGAFLRARPGVDKIGQVSLLHIVSNDEQVYRLTDTAVDKKGVVSAAWPWSLALPTRGHLLELADDPQPKALPSGLGRLTIGSSFVIGRAGA